MIGEHILRGSKHPDEGGLWKVEANQGDREMPDAPNKADYDRVFLKWLIFEHIVEITTLIPRL